MYRRTARQTNLPTTKLEQLNWWSTSKKWCSVYFQFRQLRSAACNDLLIPRTRTASYGPRSFSVSSPTCWNTCRRNWSLLHWRCRSSVTDSKLHCFLVAMRERCRHDFIIRPRGDKSILWLVSYGISNYKLLCVRCYSLAISGVTCGHWKWHHSTDTSQTHWFHGHTLSES